MKAMIEQKDSPDFLPVDLRDWFAIHAPEPPEWWLKQQQQIGVSDLQRLIKWRWVWADEMIAGREPSSP
jgi:hypothetical protein